MALARSERVGTLYVVGTPIGNLEDVTLRALATLKSVQIVAAEDTRIVVRLLSRHGIQTPTLSYHAHSTPKRRADILARLDTGDVALVTDAGTPGISDPGADLVAAARALGHAVEPIPGPSAVTAALSAAGVSADRFTFLGFPPRARRERTELLATVAALPWPIVCFEAPHRLRATLAALIAALGDRPVMVMRELTKLHEEAWTGTLSGASDEWRDREPRGEFTLVISAAAPEVAVIWSDQAVLAAMARQRDDGVGTREASRKVAAGAGRSAREVYTLWHDPANALADRSPDER